MVVGFITTYAISAVKFVSDLRQVSICLQVLWFPPPIKLNARNIKYTFVLCIMFKIMFMTTLFVLLYVRVGNLLTWKTLFVKMGGGTLANETSLTRYSFSCLYQMKNARGHACVSWGNRICLFLRLIYWILDLFRRYSIYCFSLY